MIDRDPWDPPEPDPQHVDPDWLDGLHQITCREPAVEPLQEGEVEAIREAFYFKPWDDPTRYQDGFRILFVAMAGIAERGESSHDATQALRRVMARVLHGEEQAEVNRHGM